MSDETQDQTSPSPGEAETTTAPVRVPNVSPGARSGLDHEVIGSNAQAAYDANQSLTAGEVPETEDSLTGETVATETTPGTGPQEVTVPDGTLDEQIAWVSGEGEDITPETRSARADALYAQESAKDGFSEDDGDALAARLHAAVGDTGDGQDGAQETPDTPEGTEGAPTPENGTTEGDTPPAQ